MNSIGLLDRGDCTHEGPQKYWPCAICIVKRSDTRVEQAEALVERALAMLRLLEWRGQIKSADDLCPDCGSSRRVLTDQWHTGHTTHCTLAGLLADPLGARLAEEQRALGERAGQAEALVERLHEDMKKARATMDAAANTIRGLEDDPEAVRVALSKLDYGRQEAATALLLADPTGARLAEERRALEALFSRLQNWAMTGTCPICKAIDVDRRGKHIPFCEFAAVERARGGQG